MKNKLYFRSILFSILLSLTLAACNGIPQALNVNELPNNVLAASQPKLSVESEPIAQAALNGTLEEIYTRVSPSVVHVQVVQLPGSNNVDMPTFPGFPGSPDVPQSDMPLRGEGSGFVWDKAGHIVTNNHVIEGADKITVIFSDGRMETASVVGADPDADLAVLAVDVAEDTIQPVTVADSIQLQVGDLAIAIGNPFGQEGTMTTGIVSALGRLLPVESTALDEPHYNIPDVIQTDAAINPGNSGGVLLNDQGEVIGVTSAIISAVRSSSGIGFAIPSVIVQQVVPALIAEGHYDHPYLGISGASLTPSLAEEMGLVTDQRGALVMEVMPDSPAAEAELMGSGKQVEIDGQQVQVGGDVITAVDGHAVEGIDDLISYLYRYGQVSQNLSLTILRDGKEQEVAVTLQARPRVESEPASQAAAEQNSSARAWMGISALDVTGDIAAALDLDQSQDGALILQVEPGSPAAVAGLQGGNTPSTIQGERVLLGGDIITAANGESIHGVEDLRNIVKQAAPGDLLQLTILRDSQEQQVSLKLSERVN